MANPYITLNIHMLNPQIIQSLLFYVLISKLAIMISITFYFDFINIMFIVLIFIILNRSYKNDVILISLQLILVKIGLISIILVLHFCLIELKGFLFIFGQFLCRFIKQILALELSYRSVYTPVSISTFPCFFIFVIF